MQSSRFIFFFKIWAIVFATTLYFAQASIAQSPEQRLIRPLSTRSPSECRRRLLNQSPSKYTRNEIPKEEEQQLPQQDFVVYGRAKEPIGAGIAPRVDYRPILYAREPEFDLEFPEPENRKRNLEAYAGLRKFFYLWRHPRTPHAYRCPPLEKLDIVISELMWGVDTGVKDTTVDI